MPYPFLIRQALIAASANAAINGLQAWFSMRGQTDLSLTVDSISGGSGTVLSNGVVMAFTLGMVATGVTFLTFRSAARKKGVPLEADLRFWPRYGLLMLKNAVFLFGALVMATVLFHRWLGEVRVDGTQAALVTATIAFAVSLYSALSTMGLMVERRSR